MGVNLLGNISLELSVLETGPEPTQPPHGLGRFEDALNGGDDLRELVALGRKLLSSRTRDRVIAGSPIVLGGAPFSVNIPVEQQSLQRRIQRAFPDLQNVIGQRFQALGDAVTVLRT
jgi:hypothetical protein